MNTLMTLAAVEAGQQPFVLIGIVLSCMLSLIVGGFAGMLTKADGKSWPTAMLFGGGAFGGTMLMCAAFLALIV
ncbi:hypothetical protein ACFVFS_37780 [Kitasatospora sp. NPDC057692]|uniref:hypothetical protein n=1 Tax=Kitasatospora sp. NPDC057692 TaxID=3346215 RepID=UPI00367CB0FA